MSAEEGVGVFITSRLLSELGLPEGLEGVEVLEGGPSEMLEAAGRGALLMTDDELNSLMDAGVHVTVVPLDDAQVYAPSRTLDMLKRIHSKISLLMDRKKRVMEPLKGVSVIVMLILLTAGRQDAASYLALLIDP